MGHFGSSKYCELRLFFLCSFEARCCAGQSRYNICRSGHRATERARSYFEGYFPSSPSAGILQDGQIAYMLERHQIEGRDAARFLLGAVYMTPAPAAVRDFRCCASESITRRKPKDAVTSSIFYRMSRVWPRNSVGRTSILEPGDVHAIEINIAEFERVLPLMTCCRACTVGTDDHANLTSCAAPRKNRCRAL